MEYQENTICMTSQELSGIISDDLLRQLASRKKVRKVRRGCFGTPALYDIDTLPYEYKIKVYERYPDLEEKETSTPFVEEVVLDTEAVAYYESYQLEDGRRLPLDKQAEYANNASILNAFDRKIQVADGVRQSQSQPRLPRTKFWNDATAALRRIEAAGWSHSLPEQPRTLQRKYNLYKKGGYEALISGKWANKNSAKIIGEEQEATLLALIAHPNNLDDTLIVDLYNKVVDAKSLAEGETWKYITRETVGYWRRKHQSLTKLGRKGVNEHRANGQMTVKRRRPGVACYMWSVDGWQAELLYQKRPKNGGAITYHNRKTVVVVLDPCCDYPLGYAIGDHESPELIKAALRNAIIHLRWLTGDLLKVNQIQTDHYAIKTLTPLYACVADKVVPASVGNAKAKPVERYFNYLNTKYCQTQLNWAGKGIKSRDGKQPSTEALNRNRKIFPDEKEVVMQIAGIMDQDRMLKMDKYKEFLSRLEGERRIELPRERYLLHFGLDNGHTNTLEAKGLRPTILGMRREYECYDPSFRDHAREKWTIKYDPDDLSTALAVNQDGTLRYLLELKPEQPMALVERQDGDAEALARVMAYNKDLEAKQTAKLVANHEIASRVLEQTSIKGFLEGRLLCDSKGQHKDQRSKELSGSTIEEVDYEEEYDTIITSQPKEDFETAKKNIPSWLSKL